MEVGVGRPLDSSLVVSCHQDISFFFINSLRTCEPLSGLWYAGSKVETGSRADPVNRVPTQV